MKDVDNMKKIFLRIIILLVLIIPFNVNAEVIQISNLEQLIGFFNNGGEGILTDDINFDDNVFVRKISKLDLSGHTLNTLNYSLVVLNDFTVVDTSNSSSGKIVGTENYSVQVGTSSSTADFLLKSGSILPVDGTSARAIHVVDGLFTMNGGKVVADDYTIYNSSNVIINGGEVIANNDIAIKGNEGSNTIINGGNIKMLADGTAINLGGSCSLEMNGGVVDATSTDGYGIVAFKQTSLTINDGTIKADKLAVCGNGSISGKNEGTNAKFKINGGNIISNTSTALYVPQIKGETVITGGVISGKSGVEIRAGKIIITGGTIIADSSDYYVNANSSGVTTYGAALAISQHNTKQPIEVVITGGNLSGNVAVSEANPQENESEYINKIKMNLSGGTYISESVSTVKSEDCDNFITGGVYSYSVDEFVDEGYREKQEENQVSVYKIRNISVSEEQEDNILLSTNQTIYGDQVEVTITNTTNDYDIVSVDVTDSNNNTIPVQNNKFISPDSDLNVSIIFAKVIIPTLGENKIGVLNSEKVKDIILKSLKDNSSIYSNNSNNELIVELIIKEKDLTDDVKNDISKIIITDSTLNIKLYDIYISVKDKNGNEIGRLDELNEDIEIGAFLDVLSNDLSDNYIRTYYVVRNHNIYNILNSSLSDDGLKLLFKSRKYSDYAFVYVDTLKDESLPSVNPDDIEKTEENSSTGSNIPSDLDENSEVGDIVPLPEQDDSNNQTNSNSSTGNKAGNPITVDKIVMYLLIFIISTYGIYQANELRKKFFG